MTKKNHPVAERFIERLGLATEAEGLPRIAGRIMAYLILADEACTFDDLTEGLQISRGSVSTNARLLHSLGILERVSKPGDRKDYYIIAKDPYGRLIEGQVERMKKTDRIISECAAELPAQYRSAHARLRGMDQFYRYAIRNTEEFLRGWREEAER